MQLTHHYAESLPDLVSRVTPKALQHSKLALLNTELAEQFHVPASWRSSEGLHQALFADRGELNQRSVAQKYGGHQFGQWNPMLGDGRGLLLGALTDSAGNTMDLHLKGAGPTPYSRHADGRAVLRSTIREYIAGEALHHLGIPTSRSLCLLTSEEWVYREQPEYGAMMIRMAPSHIRFGHFEYFFHSGDKVKLDALVQYTLRHHFPECRQADNPVAAMLAQITLRTARMIALWQAYGFVHGVMNTDNMSIHGITFDYGPYAFIDNFVSSAVYNHSDHEGRYAFDRQPGVALWDLNALAYSFSDYCSVDELKAALGQFEPTFIAQFQQRMLMRLGLEESNNHINLVNQWLQLLESQQSDYNYSFRLLAETDIALTTPTLRDHFVDRPAFDAWWRAYQSVRLNQTDRSPSSLFSSNPVVIARTHYLQSAIDAAEGGDFTETEELLKALHNPFVLNDDTRRFHLPPKNTEQPILSCSS